MKTEKQTIIKDLVIENVKYESYDFENRNNNSNGNIKNYTENQVETIRKMDNKPLEINKRDQLVTTDLERFGLSGKASGRQSQVDHVYEKQIISQQNTNVVELEHGKSKKDD